MISYHKRDELREKLASVQSECKGNMENSLPDKPAFPNSYRIVSIKLRESWEKGSKEIPVVEN